MFEFKGTSLHISRAESGDITFISQDDPFQAGDVIEFKIYEKEGLDSEPLLVKEKEINAETSTTTLVLLSADTNLGDPVNEITEYWYEVKLNGDKTLLGFDTQGAKILYLYPSGIDSIAG